MRYPATPSKQTRGLNYATKAPKQMLRYKKAWESHHRVEQSCWQTDRDPRHERVCRQSIAWQHARSRTWGRPRERNTTTSSSRFSISGRKYACGGHFTVRIADSCSGQFSQLIQSREINSAMEVVQVTVSNNVDLRLGLPWLSRVQCALISVGKGNSTE